MWLKLLIYFKLFSEFNWKFYFFFFFDCFFWLKTINISCRNIFKRKQRYSVAKREFFERSCALLLDPERSSAIFHPGCSLWRDFYRFFVDSSFEHSFEWKSAKIQNYEFVLFKKFRKKKQKKFFFKHNKIILKKPTKNCPIRSGPRLILPKMSWFWGIFFVIRYECLTATEPSYLKNF